MKVRLGRRDKVGESGENNAIEGDAFEKGGVVRGSLLQAKPAAFAGVLPATPDSKRGRKEGASFKSYNRRTSRMRQEVLAYKFITSQHRRRGWS